MYGPVMGTMIDVFASRSLCESIWYYESEYEECFFAELDFSMTHAQVI